MSALGPVCPDCGGALPPNAPGGFCPACLFGLAAKGGLAPTPEARSGPLVAGSVGAEELPGAQVGRYRLLERIGEGGFGAVWMAEQTEPVRRRVALKIIKLGMDTRQVVARFEAERQALALMDHPHIARVYDGGGTAAGRPFFVMELVRGLPITRFCDERRLNTRERLGIFIQVCQAVQHAHQKGIIHRDLKPSNILVTELDGRPMPKVIDFGVAKAIEEPLTDKTMFTRFHQFLGTPAYMSPEQAGLGGLDVDTRTDIYALGVLLYELLTGQPPLDPTQVRAAGMEAVLRMIREAEPLKPSTRLGTLGRDGLNRAAALRNEPPQRLKGLVRGDLDWIVLKAIDKDRARRYETANGLASDLARFLEDEPVSARPPAAWYRLGKLARRHKLLVGAGAGVVAALALGLVLAGGQALRARDAERQTRRRAYAAEIYAAQQALSENNLDRATELLGRQRPKPGQEDLRGFEWRYLSQLCQGQEKASFDGDRAFAAAYSGDARWLAHGERTITIRDAATQRMVTNLNAAVESLSFSPDSLLLASGGWSDARLWDVKTWSLARVLTNACFPVLFSPDGAWLLTGQLNTNRLLLWEAGTWAPRSACPGPPDLASNVRNAYGFSQDGRLLVTPWLKMDRGHFGLRLWRFPSLEPVGELFPRGMPLFSAAFLPDGKYLLAGTFDGRLGLWDLASRRLVGSWHRHTASLVRIVVAPDARTVMSVGEDRVLNLWTWDAQSRELSHRATLRGHRGEIWAAAIAPDSRTAVTGSFDHTIKLWDLAPEPASVITSGGGLAAGHTGDAREFVFGPREGDYHWRFSDGHTQPIAVSNFPPIITTTFTRPVDVAGNPPHGVLARADGSVEIWDLTARKAVAQWAAGTDEICVVTLAADLSHVAVGSVSGPIRVWNIARREQVFACCPSTERVTALAFSPDAKLLASASLGDPRQRTCVWDLQAGHQVLALPNQDVCTWAAFSQDQRWLATCTLNTGEARLWELPSGRLHWTLKGHVMGVMRVLFSPDGRTLATGAFDGKVKLWSLGAQQEVLTLSLPLGTLFRSLVFSPDGTSLAAGYFTAVGSHEPPHEGFTVFRAFFPLE